MSPPSRLVLLACLPLLCAGCKTVYSDVYSHRRNYFVPPAPKKETTAAEKKALEEAQKAATAAQAAQAQPLLPAAPAAGTVPGLETPPAAPAAEGAAPMVPGL